MKKKNLIWVAILCLLFACDSATNNYVTPNIERNAMYYNEIQTKLNFDGETVKALQSIHKRYDKKIAQLPKEYPDMKKKIKSTKFNGKRRLEIIEMLGKEKHALLFEFEKNYSK